MAELIYKDEVYAIIGAAMEVYNTLGSGFLEGVYQEALEIEFNQRSIPFVAQPQIQVFYKGYRLKKFYVPDFQVYGKIVLEIKAEDHLTTTEDAQLLNQLKVTYLELGLLVNFGLNDKLDWKRRANTKHKTTELQKSTGKFKKISENPREIRGD